MFNRQTANRFFSCVVVLLSAWCAVSASTAADTPASPPQNPCSTEGSAVAGGTIGGVFGRILGLPGGSRAGALVGGAAAGLGCYEYNIRTKQSKTAVEADADYLKSNLVAAPEPVVVSYSTQAEAPTATRGQPLRLISVVELVNGSETPVREVREELVIANAEGKPFGTGSKPFIATTAGRFENTFEIKLPEKAGTGVYLMKTSLVVNGVTASTRDLSVQLVMEGNTATRLASR